MVIKNEISNDLVNLLVGFGWGGGKITMTKRIALANFVVIRSSQNLTEVQIYCFSDQQPLRLN